jgi:hypothetical protein
MATMNATGRQENDVCPKIVSAVLKAMRGNGEPPDAVLSMANHVRGCPACRDRIASLDRFIKSLSESKSGPEAGGPTAGEGGASRRKHRRLPTNEAVNLVFDDGSVTLARMTEVSARGAKIESPEALEHDTRFTLNRGRRSVFAAVRHCAPEGDLFTIGVEYVRDEARG